MALSAEAGPLVTFTTPQFDNNPDVGPNVWHKGDSMGDPRTGLTYSPGLPDTEPFYSWPTNGHILVIDQVPSTLSASNIASATPSSGTALALVSSSGGGITVGCSIINRATGLLVTGLLGIDVNASRTATVTFTNGSATVGWASNTVMGVQNGDAVTLTTSGTLPTPFALATTYYIVACQTGNWPDTGAKGQLLLAAQPGGAPIAATSAGSGTQTIHYVAPSTQAPISFGAIGGNGWTLGATGQVPGGSIGGPVTVYNPQWAISRCIGVTSNGDDTGGTYTIAGYDVYGFPMTQTITGLSSGQAVTTKAFKYIASVTPNGTINSTTLTVGTTDIIGLPLRADAFPNLQVWWGTTLPTLVTVDTGSGPAFIAADISVPTASTGDVRGTVNLAATTGLGFASNGTRRLVVYQSVPPANLTTQVGLLGQTQF
jgi:hypothetical protein